MSIEVLYQEEVCSNQTDHTLKEHFLSHPILARFLLKANSSPSSLAQAMSYHMRRKELEIKDTATLKKILKSVKYVTIALAKNNQPYLVSLSHGYDEQNNCIYFHCANEGKKIDYLKANNLVWGQALLDGGYQEDECNHFFATTQFQGRVTFLKTIKEKQKAAELMIKQLNRKPRKMITDTTPEKLKKTTFGRINIEYMSGKKHGEMNL